MEKNVHREQRAHGLPYTDDKGKMHAPRSLKPNPCIGKRCQNKCGLLWTEKARLQLFQMYWSLGHQQQRDFLVSSQEDAPLTHSTVTVLQYDRLRDKRVLILLAQHQGPWGGRANQGDAHRRYWT